MTLTHILVFSAAALLYVTVLPTRWREWALFAGSIIAIFWLQPSLVIRWLDFIFPVATLGLVTLAWLLTRAPDQRWTRQDAVAAGMLAGLVLLLSFGRYIVPAYRLTPSSPPPPVTAALWIMGLTVIAAALYVAPIKQRVTTTLGIVLLLGVFIVLKTEPFAEEVSRQLRTWEGRSTVFASATELEWLGFSYVAFRLIHTLRDRQTGLLPALSLRDYVTYMIFFPAFTAGPIDRAERFLSDMQALPTMVGRDATRITQGTMRIAVGIGKKFVIADALAYFSLNATSAEQATSTGGVWVLLYAYALQIYFDFSGYSDIAIGIGQIFGIKLPENFSLPYLKRNITQFWQSWHITLSQWVRSYVFSPLSRWLVKRKQSPMRVAFLGQLATMLVIGLWHGVTWGFVVWGLWHGIGLFIHKVWSDKTRRYYIQLRQRPRLSQAIGVAGTMLTFHFVVLGWVWFALPDIEMSWNVFLKLFGM